MPQISARTHAAIGAAATGAALLLRRSRARLPLLVIGLGEIAAARLTGRRQPTVSGDVPVAGTGVSGEGMAAREPAAAASVAPAPVETPGPSVTPPAEPESDVERTDRIDASLPDGGDSSTGDTLVAQQEAAAAAEAAAIGGHVPAESEDPAMEPVYEAGGGEQEGWEAAEQDLIENASHGEGYAQPERDALTPELESDRSSAAYGEPDQEHSTEVEDTDR
jgi:hypothetical protein